MSDSTNLINYPHNSAIANIAANVEMVVFDFDGVFTDNHVFTFQDGTEAVMCSRADGIGLSALKAIGIKLMVLSQEENTVVGQRCKKLGLFCIQGCNNKIEMLKRQSIEWEIPLSRIAYLGNDINDIECLKIVGLPACVYDAYPEVIEVSKYRTSKLGGHGAVREFCDLIAKAKTL